MALVGMKLPNSVRAFKRTGDNPRSKAAYRAAVISKGTSVTVDEEVVELDYDHRQQRFLPVTAKAEGDSAPTQYFVLESDLTIA